MTFKVILILYNDYNLYEVFVVFIEHNLTSMKYNCHYKHYKYLIMKNNKQRNSQIGISFNSDDNIV